MKTNDPYFYDLADRIGPTISLEEEIAYDDAVSAGATALSLEAWIAARCVTRNQLHELAKR